MHLFLRQLYDIGTTRKLCGLCMGEVLVPNVRLNAVALGYAINCLLQKFPILRASFIYCNAELNMRFSDVKDLSVDSAFNVYPAALDEIELHSQLLNCIAEVKESMSLERAPLIRYCLFDADCAHAQRLIVIFNHLVCDGISSRILWRELSNFYNSQLRGETAVVKPSTTYLDFAQELLAKHQELASRLPINVELATGFLNELTYGLACTTNLADVVSRDTKICGADLTALRADAAKAGVSLSDFLLACWIHSLSRVQGTGDVTLLIWVSPHFIGDWSTSLGDLVGAVSFPLPVVFSLNGQRSFAENIQSVNEELLQGLSNAQDFAVRYFAGVEQSKLPLLPSIGFNFVSDHRPSPSLIGYTLAPEGIRIERSSKEYFDLAMGLEIEFYGQQMHVSLSATPLIAEQLSIDLLFSNLLSLLEKDSCRKRNLAN